MVILVVANGERYILFNHDLHQEGTCNFAFLYRALADPLRFQIFSNQKIYLFFSVRFIGMVDSILCSAVEHHV